MENLTNLFIGVSQTIVIVASEYELPVEGRIMEHRGPGETGSRFLKSSFHWQFAWSKNTHSRVPLQESTKNFGINNWSRSRKLINK
ncbi:hypothetical protein [Leptospira inadai]|nr:hypothetical protein [Leptospira inadai]